MNCPQCGNETTPGAAFCGNCGQALLPDLAGLPILIAPAPFVPPHGGRRAVVALVLGVMGLAGWLVPILGLAIGVAAIIFGTMSYRSPRRHLAVAGTVLGCLSVLFALGAWAYYAQAIKHGTPQASNSVVASQEIETLCYGTSAGVDLKTIRHSPESCLFDANDVATGDEYTLKGLVVTGLTPYNLAAVSKTDIDNFSQIYPGVTVDASEAGSFANSPAHAYRLGNLSGNIATVTYVLHDSPAGYNLFIIAHFSNGKEAGLAAVERNWRWK